MSFTPITLSNVSKKTEGSQPISLKNASSITLSPQNSGSSSITSLTPTTASSSLAVTKTQSLQVQNYGQQIFKSELKEGALTTKEDNKLRVNNRKGMEEVGLLLKECAELTFKSLQDYRMNSQIANKKYSENMFKLMDEVSGGNLSQESANHTSFLNECATQLGNRYYETAKQLMDLQKLQNQGALENMGSFIKVQYEMRMQEIKLLEEKINVAHKQDNHELQIQIAISNQVLKIQAQEFDQLMKSENEKNEQSLKLIEKDIEERDNIRKNEKDLKELAIQAQKNKDETTLQGKKLDYDKELQEKKMQYEKEIENKRIAAEFGVKVIETTAKIAKPHCMIQ